MNDATLDVVAGAVGGLAGGIATTGGMLLLESAGFDQASDAVKIGRRAAHQLDAQARLVESPATGGEEAAAQGAHLVLSVAAGAIYGAMRGRFDMPAPAVGMVFGLGFYALAWGAVGPSLAITEKPGETPATLLARRAMVHILFGVVTALVAERIARRR